MKKNFLLCLFFFFGLSATAQYYLEHINIVDVETGKVIANQSVCIEGSLIRSISPRAVKNPKGRVYNCTNKYLIPGLWDMHIHEGDDDSTTRYQYLPLFLANGVTGIRDMWGSDYMLKLKADIDADRLTGPRMIVGSPIIDGAHPFIRGVLAAATEMQGRHFVDSLSAAGYDFIKVYSLIREPVYLAIADECRKKGIAMEGHLPAEVGLEEAIDAGQRSFEHNFNINRYLTGKENEYLKWSHHYLDTVHSNRDGQFMVRNEPLGISEKDFYLSPVVLEKMIRNRVAIVPTLTLARGRSIDGETMAKQTEGLEYLSAGLLSYWKRQRPVLPEELVKSFGDAARFFMNKGVLVLAGTDVNNPFCVPGFGLQQELVNLHNAGLTNLQVLQTATLNPAKFLYKEKELGTVTEGKLANLLVLDDNPLLDIRNARKIHAVIAGGKYISKADIKAMLLAQKKR
jgi:imidazolonepropionase-like amidohydrolase